MEFVQSKLAGTTHSASKTPMYAQNVGEAQLLYPRCNINVSQIEINGQYSPTNSNRPVNCQIFSVPAIELNNGAKSERNKNSTARIDSHSEDWMNAPSPLSLHADNKYNE